MGEWRYSSSIVDLGTRWRWVVSFTLREIGPGTHWIGGWVGPRAGLDAVEKRQIFPRRESNPGRPAHSPSLYRLRLISGRFLQVFLPNILCIFLLCHARYMPHPSVAVLLTQRRKTFTEVLYITHVCNYRKHVLR
jgi:hypothetical protein